MFDFDKFYRMEGKQLTERGRILLWQFQLAVGKKGKCSCHLYSPCSSCTHPGNPMNLVECEEYWEDDWVTNI